MAGFAGAQWLGSMKYQGPLYGKIGNRTFDTGKTSEDWDRMESFIKSCRDDFDCDQDAHRYRTMCRACEARKALLPNSVVSANSVCSLTPETPRKDKPNQ